MVMAIFAERKKGRHAESKIVEVSRKGTRIQEDFLNYINGGDWWDYNWRGENYNN